MEKVVSLKALRYEKQYKDFYSNVKNCQMAVNCFFKADVVSKKIKIS